MDFKNNYLKNQELGYQTYHPNNLSNELVIEAESKVSLPFIKQLDTSIQMFLIWINVLIIISFTLYKITVTTQVEVER